MEHWDVIVVGAGAAGLVAATRAAERGRRTLLLEKNRKCGAKILMSGGTRCNLTHATDAAGIAAAFGRRQGAFLRSALAAFDPDAVVEMFHAAGVATKVEPGGKVFPASDSAVEVQRALLEMLRTSGAQLRRETPVTGIRADGGYWIVSTTGDDATAAAVIVTVGGQSYPGCGTTGDGYGWAKALGHKIIPPRPALAPLASSARWVAELRGVTVPDVQIELRPGDETAPVAATKRQRAERTRRGSLLLTHFGLSGPAAMNASGVLTATPHAGAWQAICDFLPAISEEALAAELAAAARNSGRRQVLTWIAERLPRRLATELLAQAQIPPDRAFAELARRERTELVAAVKRTCIPISGSLGFKKAEVTAGGVDLAEVDSRTMQSKLAPGLFFAGEILDVDGPIGGYNFQAAFSTGRLAGESA
ncbi:MAG: aminoacetone oxidase family FAD-binding enzyme [Planctomycetaceae bacterium]|nr:aminoacetone oxidase family FAD-binding enzyme [Planctomycetaceae bacterium]